MKRALALGAWWLVLLAAAPAAGAFAIEEPEISRSGRVLTLTDNGTWVPPAPGYTYLWYRCGDASTSSCTQPLVNETAQSYILRTADIGFRVRLLVTDSGGGGSALSNAAGPISSAPPVNTAAPRVSGAAQREVSLVATAGTWGGRMAGDPPFTYQWQRCATAGGASCTNISGAIGSSYQLGAADVGQYMRVFEVAEGLGKAQVVAPATAIGPVADVRFLNPFPVVVIAGRLRGRRTRLTMFVVRGPRGARVRVRCKGRRCPFRSLGGTIGKRRRLRFRRVQRTYRIGQSLEVRVAGANRIGKFTRIVFRRSRTPRRVDLCLRPGASRASSCPAG